MLHSTIRGGAGQGVQGSGPPRPDQGHLWELHPSDEFSGWGGGELRGIRVSMAGWKVWKHYEPANGHIP